MNADIAFQIGTSHSICQDYALAGERRTPTEPEEQAQPYIIISDGCSSSADTDLGARLLAKAAEQKIKTVGTNSLDVAKLHTVAAWRALTWAKLLGLRPQAVDATLITAHVVDKRLLLGCSGDGVICLKRWDGGSDVYDISYPSGYPLYPTYTHQSERLLTLTQAGHARKRTDWYTSNCDSEELRLVDSQVSDSLTEVVAFSTVDYKFATLFSDGIHSFVSTRQTLSERKSSSIPLQDVLALLSSFKNTRGNFVGRRMKMFLKDCQSRGWQHGDDLTVGALYLGE